MEANLKSLDRHCYGTGELECHCGGDLCVCGIDTLLCPGCPDCGDAEHEQPDPFDEADHNCGKHDNSRCDRVGTGYCQFHCPYRPAQWQ